MDLNRSQRVTEGQGSYWAKSIKLWDAGTEKDEADSGQIRRRASRHRIPGLRKTDPRTLHRTDFANVLSDLEIEAVVAFIKSTWPEREREYQGRVTANSKAN